MSFEKFNFTEKQIKAYLKNAKKNLKIAQEATVREVIFHFTYEALIRLAISVCAFEGLRVLARAGHHIELINKIASILESKEIKNFGNEMRKKRNNDIYGTGALISQKEVEDFLKMTEKAFLKADEYIDRKNGKTKLL